jgi:hypothetical protein
MATSTRNAQEILQRGQDLPGARSFMPLPRGELRKKYDRSTAGSHGGSNGGANSPFISPTLLKPGMIFTFKLPESSTPWLEPGRDCRQISPSRSKRTT